MERLLAVETPGARARARRQARHDVGGRRRLQGRAAHARAGAQVGARRPPHPRPAREVVPRSRAVGRARRADDPRRRAAWPTTPAVERLREAAAVYSGFLGQPLKAAEVLRKARLRAPHVAELVTDHAAALAAAGELDAAQRAIGEALATVEGDGRTSLLLLRASFRQQLGDDASAVSDLTEAYELDRERAGESLVTGLERLRARAERDGDMPTERTRHAGARAAARGQRRDRARPRRSWSTGSSATRAMPSRCTCCATSTNRSSTGTASSAAATRLAYVTEGTEQVTAALRVGEASQKAGRPGDCGPGAGAGPPAAARRRGHPRQAARDVRGRGRISPARRHPDRRRRPRQRSGAAPDQLPARRRAAAVPARGRGRRAGSGPEGARAPPRTITAR